MYVLVLENIIGFALSLSESIIQSFFSPLRIRHFALSLDSLAYLSSHFSSRKILFSISALLDYICRYIFLPAHSTLHCILYKDDLVGSLI